MSKYLVISVSLFLLFTPQIYSQATPESHATPGSHALIQGAAAAQASTVNAGVDELRARMQQQLIARAFAERQVQLRRDTEKLLALATELKQHVDKTSPSILSMDVIKKAQEIEKLAKSVKEKMRDAY